MACVIFLSSKCQYFDQTYNRLQKYYNKIIELNVDLDTNTCNVANVAPYKSDDKIRRAPPYQPAQTLDSNRAISGLIGPDGAYIVDLAPSRCHK